MYAIAFITTHQTTTDTGLLLPPERRREDHHPEDALGIAPLERRGSAGARLRSVQARERLPAADHARHGQPEPAAVGPAGARLLRAEPRHLSATSRGLRAVPGRADRAARHRRPRAQAGAEPLAGRADESGDRG